MYKITLKFPSLVSIGSTAFYEFMNQSVGEIGRSVYTIDFTTMTNLESIGSSAFYGTAFNFGTTLDLSNTKLKSIGTSNFTQFANTYDDSQVSNLITTIKFPTSVPTIGANSFKIRYGTEPSSLNYITTTIYDPEVYNTYINTNVFTGRNLRVEGDIIVLGDRMSDFYQNSSNYLT